MRRLACSLLLIVIGTATALADPPSFQAGVTRIAVQDTKPFDALIAYPTEAAETAVEEGPFRFSVSRDAPVAAGPRFPIVLFSHGGGGPGTPLGLADFLLHLARQGLIVVAPFHPGTERPFVERPRQIRKALDDGEKVKAKVTVKATDAAGNEATAKRTIRIVKRASWPPPK